MLQIIYVYWLQLQSCVMSVSKGEVSFGQVKFKCKESGPSGESWFQEKANQEACLPACTKILLIDYMSNCGLVMIKVLEKV